jgi:tetratricopeptide (TPR) repeat protein
VLTELLQGRGQVVSLIGEAGIGKSRLVSELKAVARSAAVTDGRQLLWLEGRCLELGVTTSYSLFVDLFREYFAWQPEEDDHRRVERIGAALQELVDRGDLPPERAEEMGPLIGNLLALRSGSVWDVRLKNASPEQIKYQTFLAVRDFFLALAQRQPLTLVLEDLHWADSLSLDLISLLMEVVTRGPLCLLCVYRPEREHKCGRLDSIASQKCLGRYTELHLRELSPPESLRLVTSLLRIERLPAAVREQILERSHGNPFFVEEMIRSFIDQGLLYREGVFWQAREAIETVTVPESVQSVILSRVDRLRPDLKQLLQHASVIGRLFRRRLLEQIIGEAGMLEAALWELEEQALIYQERAVPEEEYSFKHVLTQETIYGSILRRHRAGLHEQVGEAMEALDPEGLDGHYEELAYHYERSNADEKAVEYLLKAGEKARRAYLNEEAVGYFRRALERLGSQASGTDRELGTSHREWRLASLKGLGQTYHGMGQVAEAEECFRQAIALGKEMDLPRRARVRLYYWLCYMLLWQCRYHEILAVAEEGLALLGDDVECVEAALMNATLAAAAVHRGDRERYREFNLRNAPFLLRLPYSEELRWAYANIAEVYVFDREKDVEKPLKWLRALEQMARQHHDARALGEVHARMGLNILEARGDLRGALARYEQGLELFTTIGDEKLGNTCQLCRAAALIGLGELENAAECARRALAVAERVGTPRDVARSHLRLGVLSLCEGDWGSAIDAFQQMAQLYRSVGHPLEADAVLRLGHTYLAQGKQREALRQFQEVVRLAGSDADRLVAAVSGLEEAHEAPGEFRAFCRRLREQRPETDAAPLAQWHLEPTWPFAFAESRDHDAFATSLSPQWAWQDPLGDCSFRVQNGLEIRAANGRDLWSVNLSAPRLLRSVSGGFAVQTVCLPVSGEQPALGGLLLWKDPENFLRLDRGAGGKYEISFRGCLGGEHVIPGRGRLPCERVFLRLERRNGRVNALCSADGQSWFTVGDVSFSIDDPVEVGLYATGLDFLARTLYPGAYPDGTAIRFEYFQEWTGEKPHPG